MRALTRTPPVKQAIDIGFVDFVPGSREPALWSALLGNGYEITFSRHPRYVLHSCVTTRVLSEPGVRIFAPGENVRADFNISDYALDFDWLTFGDRHYRFPLFRLYPEYKHLLQNKPPAEELLAGKREFCSFVCSNARGASERRELFDAVNRIRPVSSGGAWLNNVGYRVPDKLAFQSEHKFAIAAENCSSPGYTTEKIVQTMAAHTIPIYWGDPLVTRDFNPKSFINCHDYPSFEAVAQRVAEIDQDDALWCEIMSEPWFRDGQEPEYLKQSSILDFFEHIFSQPLEQAYRRDRVGWGRIYGERMDCAFNHPVKHLARHGINTLRRRIRNGINTLRNHHG